MSVFKYVSVFAGVTDDSNSMSIFHISLLFGVIKAN